MAAAPGPRQPAAAAGAKAPLSSAGTGAPSSRDAMRLGSSSTASDRPYSDARREEFCSLRRPGCIPAGDWTNIPQPEGQGQCQKGDQDLPPVSRGLRQGLPYRFHKPRLPLRSPLRTSASASSGISRSARASCPAGVCSAPPPGRGAVPPKNRWPPRRSPAAHTWQTAGPLTRASGQLLPSSSSDRAYR